MRLKPNWSDLVVALFMFASGGILFATAITDSQNAVRNAASANAQVQLPAVLAGLWWAFSAFLIGASLFGETEDHGGGSNFNEWRRRVTDFKTVAIVVVTAVIAVGMTFVGYLAAVSAGVLAILIILGERKPVQFAVVFLIFGPGLWYLFHNVLLIRLPTYSSGGFF